MSDVTRPTIEEDVRAYYALTDDELRAYMHRTTFMLGLCRICRKSDENTVLGARYCVECGKEWLAQL